MTARRLLPLIAALLALFYVLHGPIHLTDAVCSTDTECLQLCPPSDAECDGGR